MVPAFGSFAGKHFFSSVLFYQIQDEEEDKEKTKCVNKHNRIAQKKTHSFNILKSRTKTDKSEYWIQTGWSTSIFANFAIHNITAWWRQLGFVTHTANVKRTLGVL